MHYFLLEAVPGQRPPRVDEFATAEPALAALREREAAKAPGVEVILFMADSVDALKATHGRFFMSSKELGARAEAASKRSLPRPVG